MIKYALALLLSVPVVSIGFTDSVLIQQTVSVKHFKLYGLNCTDCYLRIVAKVKRLPGVVDVRFFTRGKILEIRGSGYDMAKVHRIVQSEKQRIVL